MTTDISRRRLITTIGGAAAAAIVAPRESLARPERSRRAQTRQATPGPAPTVISNPPRDFGPDAPPTTYFTDPDVLTVDPAFNGLVQANTSIKRLWTGAPWAKGPRCSSRGRDLLRCDIPTN